MTEPLIRSSNVEKSVPQGDSRLYLLRQISFDVPEGDFLTLVAWHRYVRPAGLYRSGSRVAGDDAHCLLVTGATGCESGSNGRSSL
jgi:hypothetical protein